MLTSDQSEHWSIASFLSAPDHHTNRYYIPFRKHAQQKQAGRPSAALVSARLAVVLSWGKFSTAKSFGKMPTNLSTVGNKAKRNQLYQKQKVEKKAEQKDRRKRRAREAQELGEVSL